MSDQPASDEWPVFADCALPASCECARRADPRWGLTQCAIPGLNALAAELGWTVPYPHARMPS